MNKIHKRLLRLLVIATATIALVSMTSGKLLAIDSSDNNNPTTMAKFAKLQAVKACLSESSPSRVIGSTENSLFDREVSISVGHVIDPINENRACNNMLDFVWESIGMNRNEFMLKFYERQDKNNSSSNWIMKEGVNVKNEIEKIVDAELEKTKINSMTIYSNMKLHFNVCYTTSTENNGTSPIKIVDLGSGELKEVYLSSNKDRGLDPDDTIGVGYGMPFDDQEDGEYSCQELADYMNNSDVNNTISNIVKELAKQNIKVVDTSTPSSNTGGGKRPTDESCESNGGSLSWIACPVLDLLDGATATLDSYVQQFLEIDIKDTGREKLQDAWKVMRTFAYILLIPIMLIMVIGTATGSQFIDAYTVKKAFPRMVAAIIFIALSWFLCMELINIVNVLGTGVRGVILNPFDVPNPTLSGILAEAGAVGGTSGGTVVTGGLVLGAGAFVAGAASLGIIASTLFSATIIMGIAFILLVARQVVIMGLVVAAPLAILSWIFPGNDKLWKFWWGAFSKLLFLFPVIMAMIAMGTAFASIVKDVVQ